MKKSYQDLEFWKRVLKGLIYLIGIMMFLSTFYAIYESI